MHWLKHCCSAVKIAVSSVDVPTALQHTIAEQLHYAWTQAFSSSQGQTHRPATLRPLQAFCPTLRTAADFVRLSAYVVTCTHSPDTLSTQHKDGTDAAVFYCMCASTQLVSFGDSAHNTAVIHS